MTDLNVVCVKWGEKYGPEYVNILQDMVARNLSTPHRFICYTDDSTGIDQEKVEVRALMENRLEGWYHKLWLFSQSAGLTGRVLYFDLDTVITGRLEEIADYQGDFCMLKDFYGWTKYGSGVMSWNHEACRGIWTHYEGEGCPIMEKGDQEYICKIVNEFGPPVETWQDLYPGQVCSYKIDARSWPPDGSKVVCFHGNLNPSEHPSDWIRDVWKVGGLSEVKLESKCNVQKDQLLENIRSNMRLPIPTVKRAPDHGRTMVIVGGSPSVKHAMPEIRKAKERKGDIWSVNGTHDWLLDRGVVSDYFAMLDARDENEAFVRRSTFATKYLIASHCSPKVFKAIDSRHGRLAIWHAYEPDLKDELSKLLGEGEQVILFGGGNTVIMKLLYMGRFLGYKKFKLFGVDSSYEGDEHHAYDQPMNDGEFTLTVNVSGRQFKCAPWMMVQANDFQEQLRVLLEEGCEVTVNGNGLIPFIAQQLGGSYGT